MSTGRGHTVSLFFIKYSFGILVSLRNFETHLFYALMDLGFYEHTDRKQQSGTA